MHETSHEEISKEQEESSKEQEKLSIEHEEISKEHEENLRKMQDEELSYIERSSSYFLNEEEEEEVGFRNVEIMNSSLQRNRIFSTTSTVNNSTNNSILRNSKQFK
jgi:hypothetical protein